MLGDRVVSVDIYAVAGDLSARPGQGRICRAQIGRGTTQVDGCLGEEWDADGQEIWIVDVFELSTVAGPYLT